MAKKFLSILLTLVLVLGLLPAAGAAAVSTSPTFSDMPDNWATEALESAVANGLLVGYDGKIMPDSPLTRAQMATIIARAFGATEEGDISVYADVKSTDWFAVSMAKAYKMGVMQGYAGKMDPNSNITREQAFAVLARALKLEISSSINKTFEDEGEISDWAKGEVYALVNAGYIQGSNGRLNPQANISRAEFAQMMHNLIKQYIKAEGEYTQVADGNIMVNVPNVTLKNVTITGDLIVGDGVGDGDLILDNVTIKGRLLARGGGVHSIVIVGGGVEGKVVVAKVDGKIRVSVEGGANVEVIVIDDGKDDVIIEGTVGTVEITAPQIPIVVQNANIGNIQVATQGAANVTVAGNASVTNVVVGSGASGTTLNVAGRVGTVETSAANTAVSGTGAVTTVTTKAGANNTAVTTPSTQINNEGASGVTAGGGTTVPANGSTTNNSQGDAVVTPPPAGGGGGGGGGSSAVAVSAISVSPKTLTLTAGGATGTITATVSPANATNKNVTWTSSNEAVATVVNGVVTPVSAGTATITATTVDGGKTASTTVIIGDLLVEEGGSIQAAIDDATAGDVIIVGDGDYTENLTINKAITLKSLNGSESTKIAGTITIVPLDDEKLQDVTVEGFTVTAPAGYKVYPVIHMNNLENVNILNNSVVADDTAYGAIGTSDGPAKVTGIISGNTVTGMIIVGTDGDLEVSDNNVKLTPASTEGICFYPVGSTAVITVTGNTVGDVTEGNVQIKVNEKPLSVNGENSELDMLAAITADNNEATAKLGWFTLADSTVAVIGATQYDTLRTAIDAAEEGDTIFLLPGEIHEGTRSGEILSFNLPLNMQNITIKGSGAGDSGTVFKDMTITHNHNGLAPYSFYDGLMFDSIRFENTAICLENRTWSATGHQFKDIAIKNCMFINCSGRAGVGAVYIDAQYNAGNFTFENNTVDNIVDEVGGAAAVILNPFNGNITIEGNEFKNMTEHRPLHIKFDLGNGGDDVIVVKDNTFIDNSRGILIREYGSGDDKTTINVNNNIFANTGDTNVLEGIRIDTAADGLSISGNTFTGLAEAVGFTAAKDTEANFLALKANIIENNTGATDANVTAYGTFMGDLTAYNAALEAVVEDDYTAESWGAYQAVVDANEVTEENTQAEIDAATSNINAAQEYLVLATVKNITKGLDYDTIQAAIDDAVAGNNVIKVFPGDYGTASINIIQKEGVNITLEAVGEVVLNNQIIIDGEARAAGTESLTIKGFTFDFTDAIGAVDIISTTNRLSGQSYNYSHNVTIEDNIFNGTFDATVVAIRSQSSYNLKIIGCRGEGLFSLGQITSIPDELEVRDCDVTVSEGGINYTGAGNVTIEALKVVGELYGVRAGANNEVIYSGSKLVISGSDLEAKYPVIIRGAAETVTITDSTLTPIDDGEMINNVANGNINITIDGATYITDANNLMELQNALGKAGTGDQTVMFAKDAIIDMTSQTWTPIKVDGYHGAGVVTIDGNGATLTNLSAPLFAGGFAGDSGIVIKNLTIADSEITSKNLLGSGAFIESIDSMPTITLENCALKNSSLTGSRTGGLIGWTAGYSNVNDGPVKTYITIRDCTVERNEITGTGTTGGIIGQAGANDWTYHTIENTIVTNNTITSINNENKGVASIVGTVNVGEVTITNYQANENTVNWTTDHGSTPNEKVYGRLAFGETGKLIIDGVDITE